MPLRLNTSGPMPFWRAMAAAVSLLFLASLSTAGAAAAPAAAGTKWVVSWVGSAHGPYPSGNDLAQPELTRALPKPASGARDQSFRLVVRPEIWGCQARLRFSNAFGSQPVTFADVHVGLQEAGSAIVPGPTALPALVGRPASPSRPATRSGATPSTCRSLAGAPARWPVENWRSASTCPTRAGR